MRQPHPAVETFINRASSAIAARATAALPPAHRVAMPADATEFADMTLIELGAEMLRQRGETVPYGLPAHEIYDRVQRRSMSTGDFPQLLSSALNKTLAPIYAAAEAAYRRVFKPVTVRDFRPTSFPRPGDFPQLLELSETGEIQYGSIGETANAVALATYARQIRITRRVLINDDLGALGDIGAMAARRVADFEDHLCWAQLALNGGAGPNVTDSVNGTSVTQAMFHADRRNLSGTSDPISIAAVGAGRAAMMKQISVDGIALDIRPRFLVTGADRATDAEAFTMSNVALRAAAGGGDVTVAHNPFAGELEPIATPRISGNAWYLFADPAIAPTLVSVTLRGSSGPFIRSDSPLSYDGVAFLLKHDFGAGAIDFRGAYRNPGAAPL